MIHYCSKNIHLAHARHTRNDEFYTPIDAIERELVHYPAAFADKVVFCNCDSPNSAFAQYFVSNFGRLELRKLIVTGIGGNHIEFDGSTTTTFAPIDGDFRSGACQDLLTEAHIVVTNPPFSLFNQFIKNQADAGVDFLIIGPKTAIAYKEVVPLIASGRVHLGYTTPKEFITPDGATANLAGLCKWFTTLHSDDPKPVRMFTASYDPQKYPRFDLYPAINVDNTADIPGDYDGLMGVPISAYEHLDLAQYEIVDRIARYAVIDGTYNTPGRQLTEVNGKPKFSRLIIKKINKFTNLKNIA